MHRHQKSPTSVAANCKQKLIQCLTTDGFFPYYTSLHQMHGQVIQNRKQVAGGSLKERFRAADNDMCKIKKCGKRSKKNRAEWEKSTKEANVCIGL
jgi:hypothetical protein